jgi:hypothetical protein
VFEENRSPQAAWRPTSAEYAEGWSTLFLSWAGERWATPTHFMPSRIEPTIPPTTPPSTVCFEASCGKYLSMA